MLVTWHAASRNSSIQTGCTGLSLSWPVSQPMKNHPAGMRTSAGMYSSARARKSGCVSSMVSERPQRADGVFDGDAAESEDGDLRPARFSQGGQPGGLRPGNARFPEHRSENGEVGFLGRSAKNIGGSVARSGHEKVVSGQWQVGRNFQSRAHFMRRHIFCAKMNPVGSRSQSDIRTMVN